MIRCHPTTPRRFWITRLLCADPAPGHSTTNNNHDSGSYSGPSTAGSMWTTAEDMSTPLLTGDLIHPRHNCMHFIPQTLTRVVAIIPHLHFTPSRTPNG
ncbi:hypothetical protein PSTG_20178 [Puccinia striiformis f. sp. tritici PST-78]|uniref:Uncharacterized protein n=1 Tax=Puccinia striiformis f. sp. tritici PST-78 TaxID=1165861 RepID=A0A0L0UHD2_9BASI|nr:hypothetical protein PSTG_20178 [Puccinia striiformis f. sp. tritici PST-78]